MLLNELRDVESEMKFEKDISSDEATFQNKLIDQLNGEIRNLKQNHDKLQQQMIDIEAEQKSIIPQFPDPIGILKNAEQWVHLVLWVGLLIIIIVTFAIVLFLLCKLYGLIDLICRNQRQRAHGPVVLRN